MTHDPDQRVAQRQPEGGVANPGIIRPPFVFIGSIGIGLLIHLFWPVPLLPAPANMPIGAAIVLVAAALFICAVRLFRKMDTPVPGNRPTTVMVRTGPYGFSRNPIYLAFALFQAGLAALVNSLGVLIALLPMLALMVWVVIPREERYLESRFPAEYQEYKKTVRRWLGRKYDD
jgi:protein-S-isoprenylcysteine O-methyltransferase Ste14